ncbi:hypothetical protein GE115_03070 [Agromyces sp. CFH 90414]|uniref:Uncharacterized protein n=1 Tax=Agromyces agglutinans TaxID=2662258 RepID=A0A6I2F918_9MICO|nr:hypothetical protein [Agromyces agglutinans]MRG58856.1 hypothetical protein [Agromyces agglutinans]
MIAVSLPAASAAPPSRRPPSVVAGLGWLLLGLGGATLVNAVFVWWTYGAADAVTRTLIVSGPNASGAQWIWLVALLTALLALVNGGGIRGRLVVPLVVLLAVNPITEFAALNEVAGTWDEPIGYGIGQACAMIIAGALTVAAPRPSSRRLSACAT